MAIQYLGSNLFTAGANGGFETDPSGWGFSALSGTSLARSLEQKYEGAHSARIRCTSLPPSQSASDLLYINLAELPINKNYEFAIYVKSLSNNPIAADSNTLEVQVAPAPIFGTTFFQILETGKVTVQNSKNVWTKIFVRARKVASTSSWFGNQFQLRITAPIATSMIVGGDLFVDKATVFEYQVVADPPPPPDPEDPDPPEPANSLKGIFYNQNPITTLIPATPANFPKLNFQIVNTVEVNQSLDGDTYAPALKMELEPDSGGVAEFYANAAFKGYLSAKPPLFSETTILQIKDRILRFRYKHGETYEDITEPATT